MYCLGRYLLRSSILWNNKLLNYTTKCLINKDINLSSVASLRKNQIHTSSQYKLSNKIDDIDKNDKPVNFFGSKAAAWKAKQTRSGGSDNEHILWYQPYVISGSLTIFLIYFCILREENDVDMKLSKNLFDHVEGLEEIQLTVNYKYNKKHGLDVTDIERRLKELGVDVSKL